MFLSYFDQLVLGYCIDLLKLLNDRNKKFVYEIFLGKFSCICRITVTLLLGRDNKYGVKQADGSWDGLVGYLLRGEADVAVASLTINQASISSFLIRTGFRKYRKTRVRIPLCIEMFLSTFWILVRQAIALIS